jgi:hypothetical protein
MDAISKAETFQVIGFNKDGSQFVLSSAASLEKLLAEYMLKVVRLEATKHHANILASFTKITVWNVTDGFTGFDLPYIETV